MVELRFWVGGKTEEAIKAGRARILTACGGYEDMNKLRITSAQKCMISLICGIGGKKKLMNIYLIKDSFQISGNQGEQNIRKSSS